MVARPGDWRGAAWDSVARLLADLVDKAVDRGFASAHQITNSADRRPGTAASGVELIANKAVESRSKVVGRMDSKVKDRGSTKIMDKAVGKSSSKVTEEGSKRSEEMDRSNPSVGKVTSAWVEDPSLPAGWRSCVPAPGRQPLYYSPCGNLFTSRIQVDKFLVKSATMCKTEECAREETVANTSDNAKVLEKAVDRREVEMGEEEEEEVIVLSDEELELAEGSSRKRRSTRSPAITPAKKRCKGKTSKRTKSQNAAEDEKVAEKQKVSKEHKRVTKGNGVVSGKQERMTEEQEAVLLAAFREWPVGFPELLAALAAETGLGEAEVAAWFLATRTECLHLLWQ